MNKIVYIEPYPKSLGEELHSDAITLNPQSDKVCEDKITFVPYQGIAPRKYHDIFDMDEKRKDDEGIMCYTDKHTRAFTPKFSKKVEKRSRIIELKGISLNELIAASYIDEQLKLKRGAETS